MRHLNKLATTFCAAVLGLLALTACEGGDLYNVNAPGWLQGKIDSIANNSEGPSYIDVIPNPATLGAVDNTTAWWSVFTDDVKAEPGETYQIKFTNYGGASNWNNFVIILRNGVASGEEGYYEYGILRSDNWCWNSQYTDGADSDNWCVKKMESSERDWATWLKAMNLAQCVATINNKGDGTVDVEIVMNGSDGKTYKQSYLGIPVNADDLYFSFTVDNSHVVFGEPVKIDDSEPVSIELNGVPKKVLLGTTMEEAFQNVSATVKFKNELTKTVNADELQIEAIPDMNSQGTKTLIAVYNKTYLGENCTTPLIARADFQVVDKMYKSVGATDNSGAFWSAHSDAVKVEAGETFVSYFTNYTDGGSNWNNFLVVLATADGSTEYAVLRADNFGWGNGYAACTASTESDRDWAAWLPAMDGAKVTTYVTNNGDGTADVKCVMVGNDGNTYTQEYVGINTVDPDNFYFHFTIEKAHLEFDTVIGNENNTDAFWGAHSENIQVPVGKTYAINFINYTDGGANWNNFLVALTSEDRATEYAILRADNYGWGNGYAACIPSMEPDRDWTAWLSAMDGAKVTTYVTNKGDGTADVKCVMVGNDGITYTQEYIGINTIDPDNFFFHFTIEKAHLVFE